MTKMKSKKMNKSTFAIVIMAIVMVAMLAFGGTYAYFTANAIGESVNDIETAQLELKKIGDSLTYEAHKQIVPGDYVFGAGTLHGEVDWEEGGHDYQTVDLDLGETNAAVYAFVKVTTMAYTGDVATAKPLMVPYTDGGQTKYAPVLKLIPRLGTEDDIVETLGWQQFNELNGGTQVGTSNSTYIFFFKVDDGPKDNEDLYRTEFNALDFDFSLQFDSRVHADRKQFRTAQEATTAGYTIEVSEYEGTDADDSYVIYEKTNVYVEGETDDYVSIMGVKILFKMEFRTIQQTGFNNAADAYEAAFADFGAGDYTDDDLIPTTPDSEDDAFKPATT